MDILLNSKRNKQSVAVNNTIQIPIDRDAKLLPFTDFTENMDMSQVYDEERESSNKVRLMISIHPYCTNVLFNNFTEIIHYNEDTEKFEFLGYNEDTPTHIPPKQDFLPLTYKGGYNFNWTALEAIRDTQLSNPKCNYTYYCGLNIFNNHLLRKNTFKVVNKILNEDIPNDGKNFNTLSDKLREYNGEIVLDYSDVRYMQTPQLERHLYLREEVDTFKDAVANRLSEENGWFGFNNVSNIKTYEEVDDEYPMELGIDKVINSSEPCEFVYMYPTPDLYSFTPKYNKYKNRYEKNWNYCLTYPSSATTEGFEDFIETNPYIVNGVLGDNLNGLKIARFIEYNGEITFYSITNHGLNEGDKINIYLLQETDDGNLNQRIFSNAEITRLGGEDGEDKEYIFTINNGGYKISDKWHEITSEEYKLHTFKTESGSFTISTNRSCCKYDVSGRIIPVINNWVNCDLTKQNISFKKVVEGVEVQYYVRIFSKLPNWRFTNELVDEYNIYDNPKTKDKLLKTYQEREYEFDSVNSDMSYSKTIYNDDVSQIVFTDDVDLSYLHDNLGRPLHEIFLTVIKNNLGYKHWYRENSEPNENINERSESIWDRIEYSHAFGKVNCAFKYSKYSMYNNDLTNVLELYNGLDDSRDGLTLSYREQEEGESEYAEDEINYYEDIHYFGDLCSFSPNTSMEESIEQVSFRFNTAQRESKNDRIIPRDLCFDEIETDDFDYNEFVMQDSANTKYVSSRNRKEGYYYSPHYRIQVHSFSSELETQYAQSFEIKDFFSKVRIERENGDVDEAYQIATVKRNFFEANDKFLIMNINNGKTIEGLILSTTNVFSLRPILSNKSYYATFNKEDENFVKDAIENKENYKIIRPTSTIPTFAKLLGDGTARYAWRNLIKNGFDNSSPLEEYPFTNGAYYITPRFNVFLHRQDPHDEIRKWTYNGEFTLKPESYPYDPSGKQQDVDDLNTYFTELQIKC